MPAGWAIVARTTEEVPFGHHFCENYDGLRGTRFVVKGTNPVQSEFLDQQNEWRAVTVGTESIDMWVMPGDYLSAGRTASARYLAEKAVILLEPEHLLGTVVWP